MMLDDVEFSYKITPKLDMSKLYDNVWDELN
jgi:hypothetical protein